MSDNPQPVELYRAANSIEAHMVCNHLVDAGIQAQVLGDMLEASAGGLPVGDSTAAAVYVDRSDLERAQQLITSLDKSLRNPESAVRIQFSLQSMIVLQMVMAVLFTIYVFLEPDFAAAYTALMGLLGASLFVASWIGLRRRRRSWADD
jgi:hypothetical protein